ncbi:hypothetical protein ES707_22733 [subsurface metagenome]
MAKCLVTGGAGFIGSHLAKKLLELGHQVIVLELAEEVIKALRKDRYPIEHLSPRIDVQHAYANHDKLKKIFNYQPKYTLEEGPKRMAEWAKLWEAE